MKQALYFVTYRILGEMEIISEGDVFDTMIVAGRKFHNDSVLAVTVIDNVNGQIVLNLDKTLPREKWTMDSMYRLLTDLKKSGKLLSF